MRGQKNKRERRTCKSWWCMGLVDRSVARPTVGVWGHRGVLDSRVPSLSSPTPASEAVYSP